MENQKRVQELGLKHLASGLASGNLKKKKKQLTNDKSSGEENDGEYVCGDDILPISEDDRELDAPKKVHYSLFRKEYIHLKCQFKIRKNRKNY